MICINNGNAWGIIPNSRWKSHASAFAIGFGLFGAGSEMPVLPSILSIHPAYADLDSDAEFSGNVARPINVISVSAPSAVDGSAAVSTQKPILKDSSDDESYLSSLQREQKKQEARKKSKTQRSKDLCESLGRGC